MTIVTNNPPKRRPRRVGLIFDERMCGHKNPGKSSHPESPYRIRAIWDKLNNSGVAKRCVILKAKEAEDSQLALVHTKEHIDLIKTISSKDFKTMSNCAKKFDSIYFNKGSSKAAYLAAGSVIEAAEKVAKGELDSAFAIVRPPGHHAEEAKPMGFCLHNNVAIAASFLLNERPELGMRKILIVDWDVHHGNSTQKMFYKDPRVLFFSVHRHESGRFYPYGNDGSYNMTGEGAGAGYNINVPWENDMCGDADYFAVWDHILIPVAEEFDPDMIIISAGFDAAIGDPIGGCRVSSNGYSIMLNKLMDFARGKIVMALEGGYNPIQLANSVQACIELLLEDRPLIRSLEDLPLKSTWLVIQAVRQALCVYWPVLAAKLPDKGINNTSSQIGVDIRVGHALSHTTSLQANIEVEQVSVGNREDDDESQHSVEDDDESRHSAEDDDESQHYAEDDDESQHSAEDDDESEHCVEDDDESEHCVEDDDESRHSTEDDDESRHFVEYDDESQHSVEDDDESSTDESHQERMTERTHEVVRESSNAAERSEDEGPSTAAGGAGELDKPDSEGEDLSAQDDEQFNQLQTRYNKWLEKRYSRSRELVSWTAWHEEEDWVFEFTQARSVEEAMDPAKFLDILTRKRLESIQYKKELRSKATEGRNDDLESAQACENAPRKRARVGPSDTSPWHGVGKCLFSYEVNPLDDAEPFGDRTDTSLLGDEMSEDDIKRSIRRSAEEFKTELHRSLTRMNTLFSTAYLAGVQHEVHATRLEAAKKKSRDEVTYLRKKNKQLESARNRAEKALDHEITTGDKFLKSEFGKEWLKKAKNDAVDEFKKSEAFQNEVLDAVSHIHDEAIKLFRQSFSSTGRSRGDS